MANYRISFQLYSARNFPPIDGVLEGLAAIGYDAVEPYGGNYLDDAKGFRAKADALGLAIPTAHVPLQLLDEDRARAVDLAKTLGLETVILPHVGGDARPKDVEGWKAFGRRLNQHAGHLREAGLKLAWHNHDFEYLPLADKSRPIDHILAGGGVLFEPDVAWIARAGADIAAELAKYGSRVAAFHIKDTAPKGVTKDDGWTDVGAGTIDWKALWPTIARSGATLLVMENDNPSDWRAFATNSYKYVNGLTGRG
ncbi:MAG: sugar phosphate isomerase/epimerase [Bauldia sp.]|nr:sugar phosphate isomerase/epimerase [Bauldia sp.]